MQLRNKKGFTLVEIMIVVVIIGLLAAMAIPAFNRVRKQARQTALISDGRIIGNAAQQFFLTTGKSVANITYVATSGELNGDLTPWVKVVGKNYTFTDTTITSGVTGAAFTIQQAGAFNAVGVTFSDEGKTTFDPNAE